MRRPAILVLVLINAALALFLAWLWLTPSGAFKNTTWLPPAAHKTDYAQMLPALPGNAQVDTSKFVAMLDRPLFMMTRRPPPPPPPPPPEVPPPVDPLNTARISGVFSGSAGGGIIINLSGKDRRVRLNEAIEGGWTLQSISGSSVTFTGSGQTRVMTLPRAALTTYSGLPLGGVAPTPAPPGAQGQGSLVPTPGTDAAPGSAPPRNTPNPGRAVFGGSR